MHITEPIGQDSPYMIKYPKELASLISYFKKLPGIGHKSAERFAFHLFSWRMEELRHFGARLAEIKERIVPCEECGCLMEGRGCPFCTNAARNSSLLCITAWPRDVYAIEGMGHFHGLYHVLGALLSPLDGHLTDHLDLPRLEKRLEKLEIEEVILALDSTLEGDATTLFLREQFKKKAIKISRLAFGIPIGSSLDFIDPGTLSQAFSDRKRI